MPPAELSGFYWNEEKNRYFPLSAKPKPVAESDAHRRRFHTLLSSESPNPTPIENLNRKQTNVLWRSEESRRGTPFRHRRERATHDILCSHFSSTSYLEHTPIPVYGSITSFCTASLNGQTRCFIGDDRGWLYTSTTPDNPPGISFVHEWSAELNLQPSSEISSICISGSRCVATCFGPSAKISVQDLNLPGRTSILNLNGIHDVWTSHLQGSALLLGANKKAVYLRDIDITPPVQLLDTQSDVFTVQQRENLIYTGARNGTIARFDMRMGNPHGQKLFEDRFKNQPRSSAVYINVVRDSQLLVSHMNGDLGTFDLRFSRGATPLMSFPGHVNSLTRKLGIAVDPSEDFLFAAGEDGRIRGWSLRTGNPLHRPAQSSFSSSSAMHVDSPSRNNDKSNPFQAVFVNPIATMQVADERDGLCLWAGSDEDLYKYCLGERVVNLH